MSNFGCWQVSQVVLDRGIYLGSSLVSQFHGLCVLWVQHIANWCKEYDYVVTWISSNTG